MNRPHEVLVRITAVGMCHTDLSVRASHTPFPLPAVLGHEDAGVVERVGHAVTCVTAGDRVVISFDSCGTCWPCEVGRPVQCRHWPALNLLGPLGCGVQTGAGAVLNVLKSRPGSTLAVFGAGAEYTLETSGVTQVLRQAVDALAIGGYCGVVGAPPFGSEASFDVSQMLDRNPHIVRINQGASVPHSSSPHSSNYTYEVACPSSASSAPSPSRTSNKQLSWH